MSSQDFCTRWTRTHWKWSSPLPHRSFCCNESKRHKFSESNLLWLLSLFLNVSEQHQMLGQMVRWLAKSKHHCGGRWKAKAVSSGHYVCPLLNWQTPLGHCFSQIIIKNLSTCSWQAIHTSIFQSQQEIKHGGTGTFCSPHHLFRWKSMNMHVRMPFLDRSCNGFVERAWHVWRQSCLYADLSSSKAPCLICSPQNLIKRKEITFMINACSAEGTEPTTLHTNICEVDVSVHNIGYFWTSGSRSHLISCQSKGQQIWSSRLKQKFSILAGNLLVITSKI